MYEDSIIINNVRLCIVRSKLMTEIKGREISTSYLLIRCPLETSDLHIIEFVKEHFPKIIFNPQNEAQQKPAPSNPRTSRQPKNDDYHRERDFLYDNIYYLFNYAKKPKSIKNTIRRLKQRVSFRKNVEYIDNLVERFSRYEQERINKRREKEAENKKTRIDNEIKEIFREVANPNGQAFDRNTYNRKYSTKLIYIAKK